MTRIRRIGRRLTFILAALTLSFTFGAAASNPNPGGALGGVMVKTSGGLSPVWTNRTYKPVDLWAYQPLVIPAVPIGISPNPIDRFIDRKLATLGLPAAPLADRRTLIRRATFDLLGLPPAPEEVDAFVHDSDNDNVAFARVVERLLASPHYGEQWGNHWLDVTRYADSAGFANDYDRGNAWRYRDYVIRSFNNDKPFDQFAREQLAGDEIDPKNPELLIATGFLRMGPWELTAMEVPKVARQHYLDDVTDAVGQVFLAAPLQCCRCHDHKFDPIPTRDYYRIQAVFGTTQLVERDAPFLAEENVGGFEERKYLLQRRDYYQKVLAGLDDKAIAGARGWYTSHHLDGSQFEKTLGQLRKKIAAEPAPATVVTLYERTRNRLMAMGIPESSLPPPHPGFTPEDFGLDRVARKGLERLRWELDRYEPFALSVYDGPTPTMKSVTAPVRLPADVPQSGEIEQTCILAGGDAFSPRDVVTPGVMSVLPESNDTDHKTLLNTVPTGLEGRRLAFATWLTNPANPLTPRVIANRIWLWHFGQGLAGNPNNFGATGKKPTDPQLLDWLAATLVDERWSLKQMHRLIMSSEAYRRSALFPDSAELAKKDPQGASYAVFKPRRLTAEELHDSMLSTSGEINLAIGGIPVRPEINLDAALQPRMVMGTFAAAWQPSPLPEQRHRRSVYALRLRGLRDPTMEVLNQPNPDLSCEHRDASCVTPQVFSLFNSAGSYQRAVALASRAMKEGGSVHERVMARTFELAFDREPTSDELHACLAHWDRMTAVHAGQTLPKPTYPKEVVREGVEENTGQKFTFVEPLEVYADFVPDPSLADVSPEVRGLAQVCLVLLNSNEFAYVY